MRFLTCPSYFKHCYHFFFQMSEITHVLPSITKKTGLNNEANFLSFNDMNQKADKFS